MSSGVSWSSGRGTWLIVVVASASEPSTRPRTAVAVTTATTTATKRANQITGRWCHVESSGTSPSDRRGWFALLGWVRLDVGGPLGDVSDVCVDVVGEQHEVEVG